MGVGGHNGGGNPHHDAKGKFSSGGSKGTPPASRAGRRTAKDTAGAAPEFIERDEPGHKYVVSKRDPVIGYGRAEQIAEAFTKEPGKPFVLYQHAGTAPGGTGQQLFHRSRFIAEPNGGLRQYSSDGAVTATHPPGRTIRYLAPASYKRRQ